MPRKRLHKYRIGEKLFSRKYGWYLGSFIRTDIREGKPVFMVKTRGPRPSFAGAYSDSSGEQGYCGMMIGNESEIRSQGLEPLMNGKYEKRDQLYNGKAVGFDCGAYVFPDPFHPRFGETTCEGVIAREPDLRHNSREFLVLVKPEDIGSVIAKLRARAETARRINPNIELAITRCSDSLNGLPADVFINKSENGYWKVLAPENGECGAYLFRPLMRYDSLID